MKTSHEHIQANPKIICMWSGPRNLSTAMMRAFENRPDTHVWDEPFFAPWLAATGKDHPGRAETLETHETDPVIVAQKCLQAPLYNLPLYREHTNGQKVNKHIYYFQKHMPHHMLDDFPLDWTQHCQHFFLIRRPDAVIASYVKGRADFEVDDIGFWPLIRFYDYLTHQGFTPPIVDCDDVLNDPQTILTQLCKTLNIPFDTTMLNWPRGKRDTDGAWAPYWYRSVWNSTGFTKPPHSKPVVSQQYQSILDECWPAYEKLHKKRVCA